MMEPVLNRLKSQIDRLRSICGNSLSPDIQVEVSNQINLLTNQYNSLTRLETKYGEGLFQACQIEIDELVEICIDCIETYTKDDGAGLLNKVRENSVRLNILQQRITAKIFKIKPSSNSDS